MKGRDYEILVVDDGSTDDTPKVLFERMSEGKPLRHIRHVILTQDWHPQNHQSFASNHQGFSPYDTITVDYGRKHFGRITVYKVLMARLSMTLPMLFL